MMVLAACETSGVIRRKFREAGHKAYSCDLLPADDGNETHHHQCDVRKLIGPRESWEAGYWHLMIACPPCTHLCVSGARWFKDKVQEQADALAFVQMLMDAPIPRICVENPIGVISTRIRKPDQIIQPWQFGHPESKATCLWLKGLPKLVPTNVLPLPASGR